MSLNPKQKVFCQEYLKDVNATRAAKRAGYSHPHVQGPRLLANVSVKTMIDELMAERAERTKVTADRILLEYARLGFANMGDLAHWGDGWVKFHASADLSKSSV